MNAARLASSASGGLRPLTDHRILFFGAGSAGVGVASQLMSFFTLQGMSQERARRRIYLVDSQGLVYDMRGRLAEHKKCACCVRSLEIKDCATDTNSSYLVFSRDDYQGPPITNLLDIIDYVKPTALLGLSTIGVPLSPPLGFLEIHQHF